MSKVNAAVLARAVLNVVAARPCPPSMTRMHSRLHPSVISSHPTSLKYRCCGCSNAVHITRVLPRMPSTTVVTYPLLKLLLLLAKLVIAVFSRIAEALQYLRKALTGQLHTGPAQAKLQSKGSKPPPPNTIAIVFAETEPTALHVPTLSQLISWCADAGLKRLYLYDPAGYIKQAALDVFSEVCHRDGSTSKHEYIIIEGWDRAEDLEPSADTIILRALSAEDSHAPILAATRDAPWLQDTRHQRSPGASHHESVELEAAERPSRTANAVSSYAAGSSTAAPAAGAGMPSGCATNSVSTSPAGPRTTARAGHQAHDDRSKDPSEATPSSHHHITEPTSQPTSQQAELTFQQLVSSMAEVSGPDVLRDPQLILVFGPVLTLAGYPPFHTKTAEIYHMGPLAEATEQKLQQCISRYCKTSQRFGA